MKKLILSLALVLSPLAVQEAKAPAPTGPEVGKAAPVFRLNTHEGQSLDVGGKSPLWTVLAFFPKAMTPG